MLIRTGKVASSLFKLVAHSIRSRGAVTASALFILSGCCLHLPSEEGTTKHLILGVGLVSVNDTESQAAVATNVRSLGVAVTDRPGLKANLGYASSKVVTVADGASVLVDVSHSPLGDMTVDITNVEGIKK